MAIALMQKFGGMSINEVATWQWILVLASSLILFWIAPFAKSKNDFFKGSKNEQAPSFWLLTSSLVISWIFAKSITNAANLGLSFGFVGGIAYAAYYLSFLVAGIIIYQMRVKGHFQSLHHFLQTRFGRSAMLLFSLLIAFRLFNEVWSNTMVIGTYFGDKGTASYYWSILVFTILTLAYALKGGLRSSLLTDLIQMLLFGGLLFVILGVLLPAKGGNVGAFVQSGSWTMAGGLNLFFVALIQVFSYPFHDPVLTDRAFIASPKRTLQSFIVATIIGSICILLFSFVGIYARMEGMQGQAAVEVSKALGFGMTLMMNFIMITSAASTLDSTFTSSAKLILIDLGDKEKASIRLGRITMILVAVAGTLPLVFSPEILSATTISGTMVIGLTPVFLFWKTKAPEASFLLSVGIGIVLGIAYAANLIPSEWYFFEGKYGDLLSINLVGLFLCILVFWIPIWLKRIKQ